MSTPGGAPIHKYVISYCVLFGVTCAYNMSYLVNSHLMFSAIPNYILTIPNNNDNNINLHQLKHSLTSHHSTEIN